ncbi:MAG: hypothetical protein H7328_08365 [Bdellovibrio sp.]|nr:hypothetical protein [Bdellovibrio sp.]
MKLDLFKFSKWISAWTAVASMVFTPIAMGKESEKISMQIMQTVLNDTGLNKSMTLGAFYEKNKDLLPPRLQKKIEPVVIKFKNQIMPTFELVSLKATNGQVVPTLRISQNGESMNMQWFGEENRYVKFGNTNLTEIDMINFDDMVVRILATDEKLRNQVTGPISTKSRINKKFAPYPEVNTREWASMSNFDKAAYIVNLRLLWLDAEKVLAEVNAKKGKKTSGNFLEKNEHFVKLFFGEEARAAAFADTCIVAGYVAKYDKKTQVCSHHLINELDAATGAPSLYSKAKQQCTGGSFSCNPAIFGTPNGQATCVTPGTNQEYQEATLYNGKCEKQSRLQAAAPNFLKSDAKVKGRYESENEKISDEIRRQNAQTEQAKNSYAATEEYLIGILKFKGLNVSDLSEKSLLDEKVMEQVLEARNSFKNQIDIAMKACDAESKESLTNDRRHEKNYWKACDNLKSRYLFVEAYFASKCKQGKLDDATLKCSCDAPKGPSVVPGAKCTIEPTGAGAAPSADISKPVVPRDCKKYGSVLGMGPDCKCAGGSDPSETAASTVTGQKQFACKDKDEKDLSDKDKEKECTGIFCSSFLKKLLWAGAAIVGGIIIYKGVQKYLGFKKPELKSPGDGCPTGGTAPCVAECKSPYARQGDGTCNGCAGCPGLGQVATPASGCNCVTQTVNPAVTSIKCPDNTSWKPTLAECPTYPCATTVPPTSFQNPQNCPAPSNATPTSGTGSSGKAR